MIALLQFNMKLCNSSSAMAFIFCCPVSRPDDLFSLLKFGFVGVHQYPSLNTLLSITVGQIVKTKVRVNLKCNKIIIIFYLVH